MKTVRIFCALALLAPTSCSAGDAEAEAVRTEGRRQSFSLGTMPLIYASADEQRYLISIDERYLGCGRTAPGRRIIENGVNVAVHFPSLEPAMCTETGPDVLRVRIGNMTEGSIESSLDGSRLNGMSVYSRDLPDEYGLRTRLSANAPYENDKVFFALSEDLDLSIECRSNINVLRGACALQAQWPGEPYIGTAFDRELLPRWREIVTHLRTLYRMEGRARLDPPGLVRR